MIGRGAVIARASTCLATGLVLLALAGPARARTTPDWLLVAAGDTAVAGAGSAPAAELLREQTLVVSAAGDVRRVERRVLRVRDPDGCALAVDAVSYFDGSSRVADARAWRITPAGRSFEFDRRRVVDQVLDSKHLYDEARLQVLDLSQEAGVGDVIGWEWTIVERGVFSQAFWCAQGPLPARLSRYVLRLPSGWHAEGVVFNEAVAARVEDGTWIWELRDLPDRRGEDWSPPLASIASCVGVSWYPPEGHAGDHPLFRDWRDVGRWLSDVSGAQAMTDDALRARAATLVHDAGDDLGRLRRIGRFVQDLPYVSIQMGLDRGGGYVPRPATQVLTQGYGDCKDKANLMRTLLHAVGIRSWLVSVYLGDPQRVSDRWASPHVFNHCIVAVRAPWGTGLAAALTDSTLGPLVLFDATDPTTPVGAVPAPLAGGVALVEAGDSSVLVRVPGGGATLNVLRREVRGQIAADGSVRATVAERSVGEDASRERHLYRMSAAAAYLRTLEARVSESVGGAHVTGVRPRDDVDSSEFRLEFDFEAPHFATQVGRGLLTFRPALVARREHVNFGDGPRRLPVRLRPVAREEVTRLRLPEGFAIEECPSSASIEMSFASYRLQCEVNTDTLLLERRLTVHRTDIPPERFADVRDFFLRVRALELAPIVLKAAETR